MDESAVAGPSILLLGYLLIHLAQTHNISDRVVLRNHLTSFGVSSLSFLFIGFTLTSTKDKAGLIGTSCSILSNNSISRDAIRGWTITAINNAVIQTQMPDSVIFPLNLAATFLGSGLTFPLIMHWTLEEGWMSLLYENMTFRDPFGMIKINIYSGGFIFGLLIFGKLEEKQTSSSEIMSTLAYILVIFGVTEMRSPQAYCEYINVIVSITVGFIVALGFSLKYKERKTIWLVQSALMCLLLIAPVHNYSLLHVLLGSLLMSLIGFPIMRILEVTSIKDKSSFFMIHLITGSLSSLMVITTSQTVSEALHQLIIQSTGSFIIFVSAATMGFLTRGIAMLKIADSNKSSSASSEIFPTDATAPADEPEAQTSHLKTEVGQGEGTRGSSSQDMQVFLYYKRWGEDKHRVVCLRNPEKIVTIIPRLDSSGK